MPPRPQSSRRLAGATLAVLLITQPAAQAAPPRQEAASNGVTITVSKPALDIRTIYAAPFLKNEEGHWYYRVDIGALGVRPTITGVHHSRDWFRPYAANLADGTYAPLFVTRRTPKGFCSSGECQRVEAYQVHLPKEIIDRAADGQPLVVKIKGADDAAFEIQVPAEHILAASEIAARSKRAP